MGQSLSQTVSIVAEPVFSKEIVPLPVSEFGSLLNLNERVYSASSGQRADAAAAGDGKLRANKITAVEIVINLAVAVCMSAIKTAAAAVSRAAGLEVNHYLS